MSYNKIVSAVFISILLCLPLWFFSSCTSPVATTTVNDSISQSEITAFQQGFGVSLNAIANAFEKKDDYHEAAKKHIEKYYGFDMGEVLFKASNVEETPFRSTSEGVLSYLIGKNSAYPKDKGFALQNFRKANWKNAGVINDENIAIAIGQSTFLKEDGSTIKQNYTMCLKKDDEGKLKLIAYKISFPCSSN